MSPGSLRNFIKRVEKKERQAPAHLGSGVHLERHKDYKARSAARHAKDDLVRRMELEASMKNPDEFYHAMENARTSQGVRVRRLPAAEGDANDAIPEINLRMAEKAEMKRIEELRALLPAQPAQRVVFLSGGDLGAEARGLDAQSGELVAELDAPGTSNRGARLLVAYASLAARRANSAENGLHGPDVDMQSGDSLGDGIVRRRPSAMSPRETGDFEPEANSRDSVDPERRSSRRSENIPESAPELTSEEVQRIRKEIDECKTKIRKIRKELGRREAEKLRQKAGSFYGKKREVGRDEYGNPIYQIRNRRMR